MENRLSGKKILVISPVYFNYYKEIIKCLRNMGAEADWFDERPSNGFFTKVILRLNENFIKHNLDKYYEGIIESVKDRNYDYILIIKPEGITVEAIKKLKQLNLDSKLVIELWDSVDNNKGATEKLNYADKVFSFEPKDCEKYGLNFLPLFYIDKYDEIAVSKSEEEYDLLFIGTVHSDRYKVLMNLKNKLEEKGYKTYFYMYIPYKIMYMGKKFLFKQYKGSKAEDFKFKPLSQEQIVSLVHKSKAVLDIHHPKQTGLTMRTIEMLGSDKKLVTTNNSIKSYDFYNKSNIQIIDRDMVNIDVKFFDKKYEPVPEKIKEKYSLESWLLELLD